MNKLMGLTLMASLFAAPCLAGPKIVRPPSVGSGEALGVDPYVAAFQKEMAAIKASMVALGTAIQAIPIPPGTRTGALAAKAAVAAQFAGLAGLQARAEAERLKMVDHMNGIKHDGLALRPAPKAAAFASKADSATLRPKDDRIFRGPGPAKESAAASPTFQPMNSRLSYNSAGGGPSSGFGMEMPMPTPGGATDAGALGGAISASPAAAAGGGGDGVGAALAGGSGASAGKSEADAKPSVNPSAESLSKNSSDVAVKAAAEKKRREEENKAAAEKKAADAKAEREKMQQMMMQALQATVQVVAQAAQAVQQANQQANQKADSSAASAPPGS